MSALWIGLGVFAAVLASAGQVLFKITGREMARRTKRTVRNTILTICINPYFLCGGFLFSLSVICSIFALRKIDFSTYYAISALNYLFIAYFSHYFLHERIDLNKCLGTGIICLGILLYIC